jgi:hypothetical protein
MQCFPRELTVLLVRKWEILQTAYLWCGGRRSLSDALAVKAVQYRGKHFAGAFDIALFALACEYL